MVIGIICDYDEKQIDKQKLIINKIYKENSEDKFVDYIIKIIEKNKLKVLIAAIKDQQICGYPLGYGDFLIDKLNLKKRIDINYFNKKVCDGKYNSTELEIICSKLPYKSLSFDISQEVNEKYFKIKGDYENIKKMNKEKDKIISEQAQELSKKDQQLSEKAHQLSEKDQQLSEKAQQLSEKDQQLSEKDQQLSEKAQQLSQKDQQLSEQAHQLSEQAQQLSKKDDEILYLKKMIEKLKKQK